jgi:hypothetical protein
MVDVYMTGKTTEEQQAISTLVVVWTNPVM